MNGDVLTTSGVAELAGIKRETVRRYAHRGDMPKPDGYLGRTPWWYVATIEAWLERRVQRL